AEIANRERELRQITEQLYIGSLDESQLASVEQPPLADIQKHLPDNAMLIAYYDDGRCLYALLLDREKLQVCTLASGLDEIDRLRQQFERNRDRALQTDPHSAAAANLAALARRSLGQLYKLLVEPFAGLLEDIGRLIVVPYSRLYYLPFHL